MCEGKQATGDFAKAAGKEILIAAVTDGAGRALGRVLKAIKPLGKKLGDFFRGAREADVRDAKYFQP